MRLPLDWNEFIGLLFVHRVRFLVVGAHALAANGGRRTQDLDIWVEPTPDNARRVCAALTAFGCVREKGADDVDSGCDRRVSGAMLRLWAVTPAPA